MKKENLDFILCSSLLHEVEDPEKLARDIYDLSDDGMVIHFNVPNGESFHRILAKHMGIIQDITDLSERNRIYQQNTVFTMEILCTLLKEAGFKIIETGSYFLKPFTHEQMYKMINDGIIDERALDGLYEMGKAYMGSEIYVNVRK